MPASLLGRLEPCTVVPAAWVLSSPVVLKMVRAEAKSREDLRREVWGSVLVSALSWLSGLEQAAEPL